MKENEPIMSKTISQHVASLEEGYAELLLENRKLGEENQSLTKANHELEDQQGITRQAFQNLLHEKDTTIAGLNETVAAKLKHITLLDEALAQAREANATLDHRLEQQNRRTATSVRIEGDKGAGPWSDDRSKAYNPLGDPGLSHPYEAHDLGRISDMNTAGRANSATCDCDHPGPFDSRNYCVKCGRKHNVPDPGLKFGEVQLAKRIYHNIHYPAIRALLGYESCRVLDIVLDLDQPGVSD